MRPRRYPYSGKKGHTLIKADHELVKKISRNTSYLENLLATNNVWRSVAVLERGEWRKIMVFVLTILTNMLITFIFLSLYSRYLAKELKKIEDRVLVYLQLKTMLQKDSPSSVKE